MASIRTGVVLAALVGALAGGCGGSSAEPGETDARRPERIVSLSPSATETLFAIGAGEQVVAVDRDSDHPPGTPRTKLAAYQPNVEAIAGYRPDLVVLPADAPRDAIAGLRRLHVPVLAQPAPDDLEGAYAEMRKLGAATGHREAGERLAREVRARVEKLIASAPETIKGKLEIRGVGIVEMKNVSDIPVAMVVELTSDIQRIPDDDRERLILGTAIPLISIDALTASAPSKVALALDRLGLKF